MKKASINIQDALKANKILKNLIIYRIIIITIILGTFILVQVYVDKSLELSPLYVIIVLTYILSIIYTILLNRINPVLFGIIQLFGDSLILSAVVYLTNGYDSPFAFLYSITIIIAGIIFQRKGTIYFSIISIFLFIITAGLHVFIIKPAEIIMTSALFSVGYKSIGFIIIGFLSSYLSEALKSASREIEVKQKNIDDLILFNQYILQSLKSGIITTDLENRITLINNAGESILGIDHDEYIGRDIGDVFEEFDHIDSRNLRTEIEYTRKGTNIFIGIMITKLYDSNQNIIGKLINLQDLTSIKKLESVVRMKQKLATIGELSAVVAHEIRNPLSSIIHSIELLNEELRLDGDPKKLIDILLKESNRLNRKLNEFLEYTRLKKPQTENTDIIALINEMLFLFKHSIKNEEKLIFKPETSSLYVPADPEQIREVLWNLLKNSLESIDKNGIITISADRARKSPSDTADASEDREYLCLKIRDNGKGIDKNRLTYIFKPFISGRKEGFGIGLAVVNSIIEMHNGWIEVDTKINEGTTFAIYIPFESREN